MRLREELDREREERNYFQLERDKIHTFWEITKRQLEEKKCELRNRERDLEEAEERHQVEIKVLKVIFTMYYAYNRNIYSYLIHYVSAHNELKTLSDMNLFLFRFISRR